MNTMELTKIVAGLCASLLVLLLVSWAADGIFGTGEGGHGGEVHHAYAIEVPEAGDDHGEEVVEAPIDIMPLMATADVAAGEKVFKKCAACHTLESGSNKVGPYLFGVVGRPKGTAEGYSFSGAFGELEGNWTEQDLSEFLTDPGDYAPGTKMSLAVPKPEDRANLIAYLATQQ